jgi:predicted alpha/beta superfamily hydrolase
MSERKQFLVSQGRYPYYETHSLPSRDIGQDFEISVQMPQQFSTAHPFPRARPRILYILDPMLHFDWIRSWLPAQSINWPLAGVPPFAIIGVGYPCNSLDDMDRIVKYMRNRDLRPPNEPMPAELTSVFGPDQAEPRGDLFFDFLENEVDPFIRSKYMVSDDPAVLYGHSYAGLFALYALFRQRPFLSHFIATSPAMIAGPDTTLFSYEEQAFRSGGLTGTLYTVLGEHEGGALPAPDRVTQNMGDNFRRLQNQLADLEHPSLTSRIEIEPNGTHATAHLYGFTRAIRWMFEQYAVPHLNPAMPQSQ